MESVTVDTFGETIPSPTSWTDKISKKQPP